jgi:hypothetical protein
LRISASGVIYRRIILLIRLTYTTYFQRKRLRKTIWAHPPFSLAAHLQVPQNEFFTNHRFQEEHALDSNQNCCMPLAVKP